MELIEVKSLIWAQKGKLYIIYETVMRILGILRFKSIHLLFYPFLHIMHMYISNDSKLDKAFEDKMNCQFQRVS